MRENRLHFRDLPPEERPAIGEKVTVISGPFAGCKGVVIDNTKPKNTDMRHRNIKVEVKFMGSSSVVQLRRDNLVDENGNPMPEYHAKEEREIAENEKAERKEQYC